MEHIEYIPKNVCANQINIILDEHIIRNVEFIGGCPGNTSGISRLVAGLSVEEVIGKLSGVRCIRGASCPDQLAKALSQHINKLEVTYNGNTACNS